MLRQYFNVHPKLHMYGKFGNRGLKPDFIYFSLFVVIILFAQRTHILYLLHQLCFNVIIISLLGRMTHLVTVIAFLTHIKK